MSDLFTEEDLDQEALEKEKERPVNPEVFSGGEGISKIFSRGESGVPSEKPYNPPNALVDESTSALIIVKSFCTFLSVNISFCFSRSVRNFCNI